MVNILKIVNEQYIAMRYRYVMPWVKKQHLNREMQIPTNPRNIKLKLLQKLTLLNLTKGVTFVKINKNWAIKVVFIYSVS